ncbi:unnamed protein product, partial [Allacma fusca]
ELHINKPGPFTLALDGVGVFAFADEIEKGLRLSKPPLASQQCFEWILRCWENNEDSRPTFLLCKEFFQDLILDTAGSYFPKDSSPSPPWGSTNTPFLDFMKARDDFRATWEGDNAAMQVDYIRVYAV